ncbi:MMPL family transporter [Nocardioides sp.]|uniref:MMPL family transporter n=1 Tax=Nocardioides sp. TaxID=35761 RepID=UPI001A1D96A1|nr:MMPL family transporter [Nocardioides sp.]MBJ7356095.1 MMPL family transporter [Nocardioides sp.]
MNRFTRRIAMTSARHPWRTIASWALLLGGIFFLAGAGGGTFSEDFSVPDSQSGQARAMLEESFPEAAKATAMVVLAAEDGETLESHAADISDVLADVAGLTHVQSVGDPFADRTVSADGRIGYALVTLDVPVREIEKPEMTVISEAVSGVEVDGLQVELGGDAVFLKAEDDTGHVGIGLLVALLVLVVVFGTLVSAVVPIGLSIVGVGAGIGGITLLAGSMEVSASAIPVAGLVGLGVGVDYALFIVARYRDNRASGQANQSALSDAMASSGSAVVFAGGTVVIATSALALTGLGVLTSIGLSTAMMVLFAVAAATTLLPAVLTLLGDRIDRGKVVRRHRPATQPQDTAWWRFGHRVSARPWPYLLGSVVALLAIATPTLWLQTAFPAAGDAPAGTTHRQAYDLLTEGFGVGFNGPLLVVADLDAPGVGADGLDGLTADIDALPRIASVTEPQVSADGRTAVFQALPTTGPADLDTSLAIDQVRDLIPGNVYVSGITAVTDDVNTQLRDKLPLFMGVVIAISFLLLTMVFRSVVVPLKAAAMNLLSIGAAYGVLVAVFQWGWGGSLIGLEGPTPITSIIIVLMFPILFGLSMDYEVFLLSRVREELERTGDNVESVARGLAGTGRVITSAALIMIVVFLSFVASPVPSLKMLGLGLATAILVDATIVRMVLVPATMALLGNANWWLPAWLDRVLPRVTVESDPVAAPLDGVRRQELVAR